MEKTVKTYSPVCVTPKDYTSNVLVNVVRIYDAYKKKGFDTREKFVNVVMEQVDGVVYFENMSPLEIIKLLQNFWQIRVRDERLNTALDNILQELKSE